MNAEIWLDNLYKYVTAVSCCFRKQLSVASFFCSLDLQYTKLRHAPHCEAVASSFDLDGLVGHSRQYKLPSMSCKPPELHLSSLTSKFNQRKISNRNFAVIIYGMSVIYGKRFVWKVSNQVHRKFSRRKSSMAICRVTATPRAPADLESRLWRCSMVYLLLVSHCS